MKPTKMTTTVAAIGTKIFRLAHSGSHGKSSFIMGGSPSGGAMVPENQQTFVLRALAAQDTNNDDGDDND